jgi:hypothetical protein
MVDVDEPELIGGTLEGSGDRSGPHDINRIEESAENDDRHAVALVIFEIHATPVAAVGGERHLPRMTEYATR